jgi:hypothetical protein
MANVNTLRLLGARRTRNQQKQARKNGTAKLIFLLENIMLFFKILTYFYLKVFSGELSQAKKPFEIM